MSYVEPGTQALQNLSAEIENGQIKIPQFQRDYVWDIEKAAALVDSVIRGYPIGALIFWRTAERLRDVRDLGRLQFPEADEGERVNYVLDGQQRLTSILASLYGLTVQLRDGQEVLFSSLLVHLNRSDDELPIVRIDLPDEHGAVCVPLTQLWSRRGPEFDACTAEIRDTRDEYSDRLRTYGIPKVTLLNAELSVATEVFSRINTGGRELTVFEIMVAKTYDPGQDFDLVDRFESFSEELQDAGFDSMGASDVLQLITLMLSDDCKKSTMLNLDTRSFIDTWPNAIENMRAAIDYIKTSFRIPVSRLLPYPSLVIPISLFFHGNERKPPTNRQAKLLQEFFWQAGWSGRYRSSADSNLAQDKRTIASILAERRTRFEWAAPVSVDYVIDAKFSMSNAFSRTVLALLASLQPRNYKNGNLVNLRNDWMRQAGSVNFHHVFPKACLKEWGYSSWEINRVLNISLVDDFLNKRDIRARPPSDYMEEFYNENGEFEDTMATHLIEVRWEEGDENASAAIWFDDYDRFIQERASAIVGLMKSKMSR